MVAKLQTFMRGVVLAVVVGLHGLMTNLLGADKTWNGGIAGNWLEADHWDPPGVPEPADSVRITTSGQIVIPEDVVIASLELRRTWLIVSNRLTVMNLVIS